MENKELEAINQLSEKVTTLMNTLYNEVYKLRKDNLQLQRLVVDLANLVRAMDPSVQQKVDVILKQNTGENTNLTDPFKKK